jgi:soluble lytic murein transglycosylase-like protein
MGMRARGIAGTLAAAVAVLLVGGCSAGSFSIAPLPGAKTPLVAARAAPPAGEPQVLAFAAVPTGPAEINALVSKYSAHYDVPESLIHRVIKRESGYRAGARNGPYMGLMQISTATARSMGYRGEPAGLLDADTNLKYAVKYLRGAWIVGGYSQDAAVRHYSRGYYYDAKAKGLLEEVGLR